MTPKPDPQRPPAGRLHQATSPYLQQHASNPVDWHEWGPAALELARRENRPIFLSIGYSACHWCHVMAHESFENPAIAAIMNRHFVNIKVDREERPDIDDVYMQATQALNQGQGGWPMCVWLTPDLQPFFAGTYFPPESRWGRPGFGDLCERIGELWRAREADLRADAARLTAYLTQPTASAAAADGTLTLAHVDRVVDLLAGAFDEHRGGMLSGGSNKFPPSAALELLMRAAHRERADPQRRERLLQRVDVTLDRMFSGGIYDQLAGGIARYSTDPDWLVPHFEKMLYDQALVTRAYVQAWQLSRAPQYAAAVRGICDYVLADLCSPDGGFYSARDADSDGEEGKYYVWTRAEIDALLAPQDAAWFCSYYDVSATGNWSDPHAPGIPKNVLHVPRNLETVARLNQTTPDLLQHSLAESVAVLRAAREQRTAPARDEKILAEWNGLMIGALARAGAALGEARYVAAAERGADFILAHLFAEKRLLRSWRDGRGGVSAFLSDYAAMIDGLLDLYEATFDARHLTQATMLNEIVLKHFACADGGFFFTADDQQHVITRARDVRDGAVPSGNSLQLMNLLRLGALLGEPRLRALADASIGAFAAEVLTNPGATERFLQGVEFTLLGAVEIAVVGAAADPRTQALLRVAQEAFLPNRVLMFADPGDARSQLRVPLLAGRGLVNGMPAAYVCRDYACERPITSAEELRVRLAPTNP